MTSERSSPSSKDREDDAISEDPAGTVKGVQKEAAAAKKRAFTLDELRAVLDAADPEWKSMILFGLYTGQRLADIATMRWSNVDLIKGEIRLTTRKTDKVMILPIAAPLRRYLEALPSSDDVNTPLHPRAFAVVERQGKSGGLSRQLLIYWLRLGFGRSKLTDPGELGGLPNVRRLGCHSTVYAGPPPRYFTKPAFRPPWCRA